MFSVILKLYPVKWRRPVVRGGGVPEGISQCVFFLFIVL